jgi:hypothetical protein
VWRDMTARGRSAAGCLNHDPGPVKSLVGPLLSAPLRAYFLREGEHSEVLSLTLLMTLYSRWLEMTLCQGAAACAMVGGSSLYPGRSTSAGFATSGGVRQLLERAGT